jgi:hypothetical protein
MVSRGRRIVTTNGSIKVTPAKSYTDVNNENYYLRELQDVLKDFKTIPDRMNHKAFVLS